MSRTASCRPFNDGADYAVIGPDAAWKGEGGFLAAGYLTKTWRIDLSGRSSWIEPQHGSSWWDGVGYAGNPAHKRCSAEEDIIAKSQLEVDAFTSAETSRKILPVPPETAQILQHQGSPRSPKALSQIDAGVQSTKVDAESHQERPSAVFGVLTSALVLALFALVSPPST